MGYGHVVLASTKGEFVPNAIKWFTGSVFSHSLITTPDILGVPMCVEAGSSGVDFTRFDNTYENSPNQAFEVWEVLVPQDVKDAAIRELLSKLEIVYGFLEYPYFIWRRICRFFGKDIKSQNNFILQGMICSQLCVSYLKLCGLSHVFEGYGEGSIAPQDLQDIFSKNPLLFKKSYSVRL